MQYKKYENALFAMIPILAGLGILTHYSALIPDFDIGFYEAATTFRCAGLIFALWGIELLVFRIIRKQTDNIRKIRLYSVITMCVYWLIVWGYCYYQCAIKAVQDWNDMMNGITD